MEQNVMERVGVGCHKGVLCTNDEECKMIFS
jgi:hypothetical protein